MLAEILLKNGNIGGTEIDVILSADLGMNPIRLATARDIGTLVLGSAEINAGDG